MGKDVVLSRKEMVFSTGPLEGVTVTLPPALSRIHAGSVHDVGLGESDVVVSAWRTFSLRFEGLFVVLLLLLLLLLLLDDSSDEVVAWKVTLCVCI